MDKEKKSHYLFGIKLFCVGIVFGIFITSTATEWFAGSDCQEYGQSETSEYFVLTAL